MLAPFLATRSHTSRSTAELDSNASPCHPSHWGVWVVQVVLAVYLLPVLALVLLIGLIGMTVARLAALVGGMTRWGRGSSDAEQGASRS